MDDFEFRNPQCEIPNSPMPYTLCATLCLEILPILLTQPRKTIFVI
jgi:hypothetical protein